MTNVTLAYMGMKDGVKVYAALNSEDEKAIGDQQIIACKLQRGKAKRSTAQNSAIHLYFEMLATKLNDSGFDMVATMLRMSKGLSLPWTASAIKERLWRPVQIHTYNVESTTQLDKDQVTVVYESLNRATCEKLGDVSVPFPDKYMKMYQDDEESGR